MANRTFNYTTYGRLVLTTMKVPNLKITCKNIFNHDHLLKKLR